MTDTNYGIKFIDGGAVFKYGKQIKQMLDFLEKCPKDKEVYSYYHPRTGQTILSYRDRRKNGQEEKENSK